LLFASRREVNLNVKDNLKGLTAIDVARKIKEERKDWESEENYQEKKGHFQEIIELIESYERNPTETIINLRKQLKLAG